MCLSSGAGAIGRTRKRKREQTSTTITPILTARAIPTEVQQHFFGGQDESHPREGKMSRPEADPIQLPDGPLQALARAELLLLRLSAQLELARLAFDGADEAARDYALTHASELTRQLREAFNLAISGYEHEVVGAARKLESPL
jgi:hypothetical protein